MQGDRPLKGIALFVKILRDWFPVLQTMSLRPVVISEINNDDVDRNIVVTYINNQNAHTVTDGSELKEKAYSFFEMADRLEISYHHTAAILRSIGQDYMRESKWDYLYSEIESI